MELNTAMKALLLGPLVAVIPAPFLENASGAREASDYFMFGPIGVAALWLLYWAPLAGVGMALTTTDLALLHRGYRLRYNGARAWWIAIASACIAFLAVPLITGHLPSRDLLAVAGLYACCTIAMRALSSLLLTGS